MPSARWREPCRKATGISPRRPAEPELAAIALALGGYVFTRYGKKPGKALRFALPAGADAARVRRIADGVFLTRDLVNTPTSDMGPDELEKAVRTLAAAHKAEVSVIKGDDLLKAEFPDDPCRRPRLGRRAAPDRHDLGHRATLRR